MLPTKESAVRFRAAKSFVASIRSYLATASPLSASDEDNAGLFVASSIMSTSRLKKSHEHYDCERAH
jgi:hypothetical protein